MFTKICPAAFFMEIRKLLYSKKFNGNYCSYVGSDFGNLIFYSSKEKILFPECSASIKQMLDIEKKLSFLVNNHMAQ